MSLHTLIRLAFLLPSLLSAQKVASTSSLIPEVSSVAPGQPFTVALKLDHPAEWHSYYKNSGGIELPPSISWTLPEGATSGPIQWPVPEVKDAYGSKSLIYPGSPIFLIEVTPPSTLSPGDTFTFSADAKWQICKTSCINENAAFPIDLPVTASPSPDPSHSALFTQARENLPTPLPPDLEAITRNSPYPAESLQLEVTGLTSTPTEFIPDQPYLRPLTDHGTAVKTDRGHTITLRRKLTDLLDSPIPQGDSISGILTAGENFLIPETTPERSSTTSAPSSSPLSSFLPILGGMLLGGLILNLMPCVFPVIGLKIMGFVRQAGENRRSIALHGLSFTLGVLASFAVLSGILFAVRSAALRTGSDHIGWGYQLQNPWVVLVLLLLMFLLGLNMFGLFELGTSATSIGGKLHSKSGHTGSFFSGVLATVVATPCSGPFLGVAIGAAMALPALQFFTAFLAMAIGLALPYLILSLFPALVENLPRPGPWMESFKQAMAFLLFATAAYLLWVYSGLIGQEYLLAPLLGLSLIATAAWIYGRWFLPHKSPTARTTAIALTALFAISGIVLALPPKPEKFWETWSQEKTDSLLTAGTPVFIDFTAQWCLTCQVNKKIAYTDEVRALARKKGIVFLKADKTKPNPAIDAKLEQLGRTAIPVNVLLIPGQKPLITPEVLTPAYLTQLFQTVP